MLDLGCGKGAVAVALASRLRCRVVGVDAFEPFIEAARSYAQRRRAAKQCDFRVGRIEAFGRAVEKFDAVVILGVCPFDQAAALARRSTRPGGVYLIDDALQVEAHADDHSNCMGFCGVPTLEQARRKLEAHGDRIERIQVMSRRDTLNSETKTLNQLRRQAALMIRQNPSRRKLLHECLQRQAEAIEVLTGPLRGVMWLVRRK